MLNLFSIRTVPVKTGTAYATNVPPARLLHAAALRPNSHRLFGLPSCVFGIIKYSAFCGKRLGGGIRSVPVKTGTAYATNMPPAYSLYAAAPRPPPPFEKGGPKLSAGAHSDVK